MGYCLGISDVCPIRFGLYFSRFLNQERMALNKLPDIDIDFVSHTREGESASACKPDGKRAAAQPRSEIKEAHRAGRRRPLLQNFRA